MEAKLLIIGTPSQKNQALIEEYKENLGTTVCNLVTIQTITILYQQKAGPWDF